MSAGEARIQRRLAVFVAVLAPVAGVLGVRLLGPEKAPASVARTSAKDVKALTVPDLPERALSEEETAAAARASTLAERDIWPFPFRVSIVADVPDTHPAEPSGAPTPPRLRLSAILRGRVDLAVIDGTPRPVGWEAAPGWVLSEIDHRRQTVVFRHDDGEAMELRIRPRPD